MKEEKKAGPRLVWIMPGILLLISIFLFANSYWRFVDGIGVVGGCGTFLLVVCLLILAFARTPLQFAATLVAAVVIVIASFYTTALSGCPGALSLAACEESAQQKLAEDRLEAKDDAVKQRGGMFLPHRDITKTVFPTGQHETAGGITLALGRFEQDSAHLAYFVVPPQCPLELLQQEVLTVRFVAVVSHEPGVSQLRHAVLVCE